MTIIDHHVHLGKDYNKTNYSLSADELISQMDSCGVDKSVIFSCPNIKPSSKNPYEKENNFILSKSSVRLIPFMFIHPYFDDVKYIKSLHKDFLGFKIYCSAKDVAYNYRNIQNTDVFNFVKSTGKPLIAHIGVNEGERAKDLVNAINSYEGEFIVAHAARFFDEDLKEISKIKNVYLDLSPLNIMLSYPRYLPLKTEFSIKLSIFSPENVLKYLYDLFENRLIWGTDSPWCNFIRSNGYAEEVSLYKKLNLETICHNINFF